MENNCPLALPQWDCTISGVPGNARNKMQSIPDHSLRGLDPIPDLAQVWRWFRDPLSEAGRSRCWTLVVVNEEHVWRLSLAPGSKFWFTCLILPQCISKSCFPDEVAPTWVSFTWAQTGVTVRWMLFSCKVRAQPRHAPTSGDTEAFLSLSGQ